MTEEVKAPRKRSSRKKDKPAELLFIQLLNTQCLVGKVPADCPLLNGLPAGAKAEDHTVIEGPVFMAPVHNPGILTIARGYLGVPFVHKPIASLPVRHWNILYCARVESQMVLRAYEESFNGENNPFTAVFEASKAMLEQASQQAKATAEEEARKKMEQDAALFHMESPSKLPS